MRDEADSDSQEQEDTRSGLCSVVSSEIERCADKTWRLLAVVNTRHVRGQIPMISDERSKASDSRDGTPLWKERFHTKEAARLVYGLGVPAREEHDNCLEGPECVAQGF